MALSLEAALGHRPETLEDFVRARILFPIVKHRDGHETGEELDDKADKELNYMSNLEFLSCISMAIEDMKEAKKEIENNHLLMEDIAQFAEHGDCYVIKKSDWDKFSDWVKENCDLDSLPGFNMLPVSFYFEES